MANLHLVTGHSGSAHVTSADHGSLYAAVFGAGHYVLNRGQKFAITVISNNTVRVADGDILMQGRHIRLNENSYVDLTIENGSSGSSRNDLIVCRYTQNQVSGEEECNLVVIKGTATTQAAADPEYTDGDILGGDEQADFPLYRIPLSGITIGTPVQLFDDDGIDIAAIIANIDELKTTLDESYAKKEYVDAAVTGSGGNIVREFYANLKGTGSTTYTTTGNQAKFYTVAVQTTAGERYRLFTFDWKAIRDLGEIEEYCYDSDETWHFSISATYNTAAKNITFTVSTNQSYQNMATLAYICGYY